MVDFFRCKLQNELQFGGEAFCYKLSTGLGGGCVRSYLSKYRVLLP